MMIPGLGDYESICRKYRREKQRRLFRRRIAGICMLEFSLMMMVAVGFLTNRCGGIVPDSVTAIFVVLKACLPCTVIIGLAAVTVALRYKLFPGNKR